MSEVTVKLLKPYPAQQKILDNAKRNNLLVISRRWGKTALSKYIVQKACLVNEKHRASISFPTFKLMLQLFEEYRSELSAVITRVSREDKRIELINGSILEFWSSDDTQAGRGRKYHIWVHDECQRQRNLSDFIFGSVRPTLADYRGQLWVLGTANGEGSDFHDLFLQASQDPTWQVAKAKLENHPIISDEEIAQMRIDLGPDYAAQELDSEWIRVDGQTPLIRQLQWEALFGTADSTGRLKTLALDASIDSDNTALSAVWTDAITGITYIEDVWLFEPDPILGEIDYIALEKQILRMWQSGQYSVLAYDPYQTVSLKQRLEAQGVRTFKFTQNSMRSLGDTYFRQRLIEGTVRHPDNPDLTKNILSCALRYGQNNYRIVKANKNALIDLAVATAMACYTNHTLGQGSGVAYTPAIHQVVNRQITPPISTPQSPFSDTRRFSPWNR